MEEHTREGGKYLPIVVPTLVYSGVQSPYPGNLDLFDEFENPNSKIETLKLDNYLNGWSEYDTYLSDHRPVMISLAMTTLGDLNSDGIIDILDVILIVEIILDESYNSIVDMNGDNIVNVLDLITVIDIILQ